MNDIVSALKSSVTESSAHGQRYLNDADKEILSKIRSNSFDYLCPMIQVSGVCNLKCTMCGGANELVPGKFMEKALFEAVCEKLKADGIPNMIIAGAYGEPFLHPQIFDLLGHAQSCGFNIILSTHGNNLDEARIKRLVELDLFHVQFSFCGYDAQTYERIYKGGKFEKAITNIRLLKEALKEKKSKTIFLVNGVCDRDDQDMATRTHALLKNLGVEESEIRIILPHNFAGRAEFEEMKQDGDIVSFKPAVSGQYLSICKVMAQTPGILWDGRVSGCGCLDHKGQLEMGNIKFSSLSEMRKSATFEQMVKAFEKGDIAGVTLCNKCDVPYGPQEAMQFSFDAV